LREQQRPHSHRAKGRVVMYAVANGGLKRRLLAILAACLILPLALTGQVGKAAPTGQTPTPNPAPNRPILLTDPVPDPRQDGVIYFSETGHTLRGKFLAYWQQNGGLAQFGYPLTEEFFEPDGPNDSFLQVQYFERNRFELHPENQPPNDVLLGSLGLEFHQHDPAAAREPSPAYFFPPTAHNLSGVFLRYWQTHGGLTANGYPISEPQMETSTNGKEYLTQWFERSRFEEHPENAGSPYEVLLGQLGRQLSGKRGYPYGWYPHFGYAVDYSWVAGYLDFYLRAGLMFPASGCSIFRYGDPDSLVQLNEPDGSPYSFHRGEQGKNLKVVFGRLAGSKEPKYGCAGNAAESAAPIYYVTSRQNNPPQQ
jgi:hypothetical protein